MYNGHKQKHALKFQIFMPSDVLILYAHGPVEGRPHDWTHYTKNEMDRQLEDAFLVDVIELCIYGYSGYNFCVYLEAPFQRGSISGEMAALNSSMSTVGLCVERRFKEVKLHWTTVDFKRKLFF